MKRDVVTQVGMVVITLLLVLNLFAGLSIHATAKAADETRIRYRVVRVDPATNQDSLFKEAGDGGWQLAGTIEVTGSTGYLIFRR